jgi:hypothetical protein
MKRNKNLVEAVCKLLAELGSECPLIGPEVACGISAGTVKEDVRDWTETIKIYWDSYKDPLSEERRNC